MFFLPPAAFLAAALGFLGIAGCSPGAPPRLDNNARSTPPPAGAITTATGAPVGTASVAATVPAAAPPPQAEPQFPIPTFGGGASSSQTAPAVARPGTPPLPTGPVVMLGIDVLEAGGFAQIAGKRVGLLSHPAGVNRLGVHTLDVLRRAKNVKLVALFGPEHGFYGDMPASQTITDTVDKKTGLPVYSLYGKNRHPTKEQLKNIDALVIDMQDIGARSYTFSVCMKYAIEACFENNVEVIVLDRPNPLGGLKVDGPILDKQFFSGVGQYQIPYVHGLTMGELARMAAGTPGALNIPEPVRAKGRLTVVPMLGWRRAMRWPETGLKFVPTSQNIRDFPACVGYAMTGLGCQIGGFKHGVGSQYPFRGIWHATRPVDQLLRDLSALKLPGLVFRKVALATPATPVPAPPAKAAPATPAKGAPVVPAKGASSSPAKSAPAGIGIYVEVSDWDDWRPTELSFHLMRLACVFDAKTQNPFAAATPVQQELFNKHTGSLAFWNALKRDGARVDLPAFLRAWRDEAIAFQHNSRKFWLYY